MTDLILRSQWGARHRDGFRDRPLPVTELWLHHSVTLAPDLVPPFDDDDAAVRLLEQIGQARFGGGISYTYPVTPSGRIYQGHSINRKGAHTLGHNTKGAAYVLVGDHRRTPPTAAACTAIAEQMVLDHRAGHATTHQLNGGHRDAPGLQGTTECPGDAAAAAIPDINRRARELWDAGYPDTPADPEGDLMGIMIRRPGTTTLYGLEDALRGIWTASLAAWRQGKANEATIREVALSVGLSEQALTDIQARVRAEFDHVDPEEETP